MSSFLLLPVPLSLPADLLFSFLESQSASGVATHFVPQTKLEDLQLKLIRSKSPEEVKEILDSFHEPNHGKTDFSSTLNSVFLPLILLTLTSPLAAPIHAIQPLVDKVFSKQTVEEIVESLIALEKEKENPISADWAKTSLSALKHSSPTSLKVVQEQLRRGGKLPLDECLKMEFRLAQK
jgi:enoyl-CoA hydratase/carnithine racemase